MDKNLLSADTIDNVLFNITVGEREPVEKYIRTLQKHHTQFRDMSEREMMPLVPLLIALQEASHFYFRQLLEITGLQLMILALKNHHPVFEKLLILNYQEDYIVYIYSALQNMEEVDCDLVHYPSQVFAFPAEHAKASRKERALMAIYECGFYLDIPFLPCHDQEHAITTAARWNNLTLARAYIMAGRRTRLLHYDRPADSYSVLIDVLNASEISYKLMELCLNNDANADVILPSGESLYDAAASHGRDMQLLILSHGGSPASPILSAIHKTVNNMTSTVVNAESFETVLDDYSRKYCHEYMNGYTLFSARQRADVFQTAVRLQNKAVLKLLLQHLKIPATDEQITQFLNWAENNPWQIDVCTPEMVTSGAENLPMQPPLNQYDAESPHKGEYQQAKPLSSEMRDYFQDGMK